MVAPVQYSMYTFFRQLVRREYAAIAKDTTRHMQLDIGSQVVLLKSTTLELIPGAFLAMLIAEVLQMAFSRLVADRTIQRVIDQQHLHHAIAGVDDLFAGDILYHHAIHDI